MYCKMTYAKPGNMSMEIDETWNLSRMGCEVLSLYSWTFSLSTHNTILFSLFNANVSSATEAQPGAARDSAFPLASDGRICLTTDLDYYFLTADMIYPPRRSR